MDLRVENFHHAHAGFFLPTVAYDDPLVFIDPHFPLKFGAAFTRLGFVSFLLFGVIVSARIAGGNGGKATHSGPTAIRHNGGQKLSGMRLELRLKTPKRSESANAKKSAGAKHLIKRHGRRVEDGSKRGRDRYAQPQGAQRSRRIRTSAERQQQRATAAQ